MYTLKTTVSRVNANGFFSPLCKESNLQISLWMFRDIYQI